MLVAAASILFSPIAAAYIGPYAVIAVCAVGGASWSASNIPESTTRKTLCHVALWTMAALVFTVPAATVLSGWTEIEVRWLFGPVAGLIAAHPDWLWVRLRGMLDRRIGHQGEQP
jgi:hypothetical protein